MKRILSFFVLLVFISDSFAVQHTTITKNQHLDSFVYSSVGAKLKILADDSLFIGDVGQDYDNHLVSGGEFKVEDSRKATVKMRFNPEKYCRCIDAFSVAYAAAYASKGYDDVSAEEFLNVTRSKDENGVWIYKDSLDPKTIFENYYSIKENEQNSFVSVEQFVSNYQIWRDIGVLFSNEIIEVIGVTKKNQVVNIVKILTNKFKIYGGGTKPVLKIKYWSSVDGKIRSTRSASYFKTVTIVRYK